MIDWKRRPGRDRALVLFATLHPESFDFEKVADSLWELNESLEIEAPQGHFLRELRVRSDALRDGRPRGTRLQALAVYLPLPKARPA